MEPVVYVLLFVTSVVGLTFIVERGIALRWRRVVPSEIEAAVESCQSPEDVPMLRRVCQQHKSPISRLLLIAAEHLDWPKAEAVDAMQTRARQEIARLERGLVVLEIIVGIAPLLGLVGTILGMMTAFGNVGQAGQIDPAELAKGISLILRATLLGPAHRHPLAHLLELLHQEGRIASPSRWSPCATNSSAANTGEEVQSPKSKV